MSTFIAAPQPEAPSTVSLSATNSTPSSGYGLTHAPKELVEHETNGMRETPVVLIQRPRSSKAVTSSSELPSSASSKPTQDLDATTVATAPEGVYTSLKDALMTSFSHNHLPENIYHRIPSSTHSGTKRTRTDEAGLGRAKRVRRDEAEEQYEPGSWSLIKVSNAIPKEAEDPDIQDDKDHGDLDDEALIRLFVVGQAGQLLPPTLSTQTRPPGQRLTGMSLSARDLNTRFVRVKDRSSLRSTLEPKPNGEDVKIDESRAEVTTASNEAGRPVDNSTTMDIVPTRTISKPGSDIPLRLRRGWIFAALDNNIHRENSGGFSNIPAFRSVRLGCFLPHEHSAAGKDSTDGLDEGSLAGHKVSNLSLHVDGTRLAGEGDQGSDNNQLPEADNNSPIKIAVLDDPDVDGEGEEEVVSDTDLLIDELADDDTQGQEQTSASASTVPPVPPSKVSVEPTPTSSGTRRSPRKPVYVPVTLTNTPRRSSARSSQGATVTASSTKTRLSSSVTTTVSAAPVGRRKSFLARSLAKEVDKQENKSLATAVAKPALRTAKRKGKAKEEDIKMTSFSSPVDKDATLHTDKSESVSHALNSSSNRTRSKSRAEKVAPGTEKARKPRTKVPPPLAPSASVSVSSAGAPDSQVHENVDKDTKDTDSVSKDKDRTNLSSTVSGVPTNQLNTSDAVPSSSHSTPTFTGSYNPYTHVRVPTTIVPSSISSQVAPQAHYPTSDQAANIQLIRDSLPSIQALPDQLQTYLLTALATGVPGMLPPAISSAPGTQAGIGYMGNAGASANAGGGGSNGFGKAGPLLSQSSTPISAAPVVQPPPSNNLLTYYPPMLVSPNNSSAPGYSLPGSHHYAFPHQYPSSTYTASFTAPYTSTATLPMYNTGSSASSAGNPGGTTFISGPSSSSRQAAPPPTAASQSQKDTRKEKVQNQAKRKKNALPTGPEHMKGNRRLDAEPIRVGPPRKQSKPNRNRNKVSRQGSKNENSNLLDEKLSSFTGLSGMPVASGSQVVQPNVVDGTQSGKLVAGVDGDENFDADGDIDLDIYAPFVVDVNNPHFALN